MCIFFIWGTVGNRSLTGILLPTRRLLHPTPSEKDFSFNPTTPPYQPHLMVLMATPFDPTCASSAYIRYLSSWLLHYNPIQLCLSQFIICYYIYISITRAEADVVFVLFGRGRARPTSTYCISQAFGPLSFLQTAPMAKINLTVDHSLLYYIGGLPILTMPHDCITRLYHSRRPYQRPHQLAMLCPTNLYHIRGGHYHAS